MDLQTSIPLAILEASGENWSGTVGDDDWNRMLSYFQMNLNIWANEPGADWESLYNPKVNCGAITATDTFTLSGFLKVSNNAHDYIYILHSDGKTVSKYKTVPGSQLKDYLTGECAVFVAGNSKAIFSRPFTSDDPEFGGTLYVPGYMTPTKPVNATDVVQIDDINWLIFMGAQEWAQPDTTLVQNVPSLVAKANDRMEAMKLNNERMKTMSQQTPIPGAGIGTTW